MFDDDDEDRIEVSFPVVTLANVSFWVERAEWEAMSLDDRKATADDRISKINYFFDRGEVDSCDTHLSANISAWEGEDPKFHVYDPKKERA